VVSAGSAFFTFCETREILEGFSGGLDQHLQARPPKGHREGIGAALQGEAVRNHGAEIHLPALHEADRARVGVLHAPSQDQGQALPPGGSGHEGGGSRPSFMLLAPTLAGRLAARLAPQHTRLRGTLRDRTPPHHPRSRLLKPPNAASPSALQKQMPTGCCPPGGATGPRAEQSAASGEVALRAASRASISP
jgi:hypothetical protein